MFGMDMGLGMMEMGAMDMGIGAMEMDMGMGMMGADMMAMGVMDMGMGMRMEGMGMGMGMGMGRGMMGAEMMAMDMGMGMGMGMGMMGGGIGICPVGCMRACCRPAPICVSGCIGPCYCSSSQQVIVRNAPNYQYNYQNPNNGFVKLPPISTPQTQYSSSQQQIPMNQTQKMQNQQYGYNNQMYAKSNTLTPQNNLTNQDIQQQKIINEQMRIEQQKQQQILMKQRMEQEELMLQKQRLEYEQRQLEQQKIDQMRIQQIKEKQRLQRLRKQQQQLQKQMYLQQSQKQTFQQRQTGFAIQQQPQQVQQSNPYQQQQQLLMYGDIYQQNFNKWQPVHGVKLTARGFLNKKIQNISKIKVKSQSCVPGTRVIKITIDGTGDMFISVPSQDQVDWMCKIIWARLERMGRPCNINESFNGSIEGQVIRKSTFKGWQTKFVVINSSGLKLFNHKGGSLTHTITSVPEIWTRFQIIHGNMLVIKMHQMGRKWQLGIPTQNAVAWLKAFYSIIRV